MGWVEDLAGKTVGIDTAPLIYFIEQRQPYVDVLRPFFQSVENGDIQVVTSAVTLLEVLVHPIRNHDEGLAQEYQDILLNATNITTVPVTPITAQIAAELRAESRLKTPDAIHLATAMNHQATSFLTNDRDFPNGTGVQILKLRELAPPGG